MKRLEIFFPPFETIVMDPGLEKYFGYGPLKEIGITYEYNVIVEKYMPLHSALFLDKDKNIVAIYLNGRLSIDRIKLKKLEPVFTALNFLKGE